MGRREHSVVVDSDSWTKTTETTKKKVIHTNTDKKTEDRTVKGKQWEGRDAQV